MNWFKFTSSQQPFYVDLDKIDLVCTNGDGSFFIHMQSFGYIIVDSPYDARLRKILDGPQLEPPGDGWRAEHPDPAETFWYGQQGPDGIIIGTKGGPRIWDEQRQKWLRLGVEQSKAPRKKRKKTTTLQEHAEELLQHSHAVTEDPERMMDAFRHEISPNVNGWEWGCTCGFRATNFVPAAHHSAATRKLGA